MKNTHFIIPSLQSDGTLSQSDAFDIYLHNLTQEYINEEKEVVRPCRSHILKAMQTVHIQYNDDVTSFVNQHLQNKGRLLFWSDQHINHNNIIKFAERPFNSVEEMNHTMVANYLTDINDDDIVVFGGDVAFGETEETQLLFQDLPGKKILVVGNHDFHKNKNEFRDFGIFDMTTMVFVFHHNINGKMINFIVTHYPIDNKWLPKNTFNIHGHIHNKNADQKNINMAVEHLNYRPQILETLIKNVRM